jgi:DNA-binding beta-propeller fold protein YncE
MKIKNVILEVLVILFLSPIFCFGQKYYSYVACESEDQIVLVSYDGQVAKVEESITVGYYPTETEGPHGVTVSTDDKHWFVSMAHGNPYGTLYKYEVGTNKLVGSTTLGLFPATMQMSPVTGLLYIVNFNLHGDMVASSISVVDPETMIEIDKIQTGVMPHGSRVSASGMKHYSLAMTSGELYEIDAL